MKTLFVEVLTSQRGVLILVATMQQVPRFLAPRQVSDSTPRLAFTEAGASDGPVVVLLHGVGSSSDTWAELMPRLSSHRRYLMPDYRGHGGSDAPAGPYVVDDFVDDLVRLLDELGIERVSIIGFSIGAVIALSFALAEPERVASLVLLNSIAGRTPAELDRARTRLALIRSTPPAELAPASAERWFTERFRAEHPELVEAELAIVSRVDHSAYAAAYEVLVETDQLDRAHEVGIPTLIATGEGDLGSTPAMSEKLAASIAGSRLVIVPELKHYMHIEDAAGIARLVDDFHDEVL